MAYYRNPCTNFSSVVAPLTYLVLNMIFVGLSHVSMFLIMLRASIYIYIHIYRERERKRVREREI